MINTIADVYRPDERVRGLIYDAIIVICGSLLVAFSSQLKFYLPFSPVPVTAQTFVVLVLGILLGSRRGALTMIAYLAEGALGLPVFAGGIGLAAILGPTGGFLFGFIASAYVVGLLAEMGWDRKIVTTIAAMIFGDAIILAFGFAWLSILTNVKTAFVAGFLSFIPGDILKVMIAAMVLPTLWKIIALQKK
jgi:biotin transport system substrate-specific component